MNRHTLGALVLTTTAGLAGCTDTSKLDERIDKLEKRNAELSDEIRDLRANDETIRKGAVELLSDVAGRMYRAGLTDEKNENILGWWCDGISCVRTQGACSLERLELKDRGMSVRDNCVQQRVAWCRGDGAMTMCMETVALCLKVKVGTERPNTCIGVE